MARLKFSILDIKLELKMSLFMQCPLRAEELWTHVLT